MSPSYILLLVAVVVTVLANAATASATKPTKSGDGFEIHTLYSPHRHQPVQTTTSPAQAVGSVRVLVTFICVLCTLRPQISL
jgi:hypothetical protein